MQRTIVSGEISLAKPKVHFSHELFDEICAHIAQGRTLREIERMENMPSASTIVHWNVANHEGCSQRYTRAREMGYAMMAEDAMDIADNVAPAPGVPDPRLRVETRKWLLSKMLPKTYGDKQTVDGKFTVDWAQVCQEAADKWTAKRKKPDSEE
jgi:Zn-dependent M32 family carboxypeptidase